MQKQTTNKPLFPDLLWSRPENKRYAGKLLVIGGSSSSLSAPAKAFSAASRAGVGSARVILPDSTRKILGKSFLEAEFAPSTPSGSLAGAALGQMLDASSWSDGVMLAGDFGKNSETIILLEKFIHKYRGPLVMSGDSLDPFLQAGSPLLERSDTLLVIEFSKLLKLAKNNFPDPPLQNFADITKTSEILNSFTAGNGVGFLTEHQHQVIVSLNGKSSATFQGAEQDSTVELAAYGIVWWLQQPSKVFEALTTAAYARLEFLTNGTAGRT